MMTWVSTCLADSKEILPFRHALDRYQKYHTVACRLGEYVICCLLDLAAQSNLKLPHDYLCTGNQENLNLPS